MISYLCILISLFVPLACTGYAKFSVKGFDNSRPREFFESLEGKARRADYAQKNFYETFPAFAVGVVVAHQLNVSEGIIDTLAVSYVVARVLYAIFYITDRHILRTLVWTLAFLIIVALYVVGIFI